MEVGETVWYFDDTSMHHEAHVTKISKDNTINVSYSYKGTTYKERDIPHKDDVTPVKEHPYRKKPDGTPDDWNAVTNCWKEKTVLGK